MLVILFDKLNQYKLCESNSGQPIIVGHSCRLHKISL